MVCAAASAGQATSRARSATLRAFIDASLVVSALLRRVGTHGLFVDRGTPARAHRQEGMAVPYLRLHPHEGGVPRHRVDIDLHDAEGWHDGAEMGGHPPRPVSVEGVRRPIHLVR